MTAIKSSSLSETYNYKVRFCVFFFVFYSICQWNSQCVLLESVCASLYFDVFKKEKDKKKRVTKLKLVSTSFINSFCTLNFIFYLKAIEFCFSKNWMLSPWIYCFHTYKCLYAYIYTCFPRRVHHVLFDFHLLVFWFLSHKRKISFLSIFSCKGSSAVPFIESESFDQVVLNSRCVSILYYYYLYIFAQLLLN